jgi:hypothetical protein
MKTIMEKPLFRTKTYTVEGSDKLAIIMTGYRGKIVSYKKVIQHLNRKGYSVIAYEHSATVLTRGDPKLLPALVRQLCDDVARRAAGSKYIICIGASIGAGLCFAIQRRIPVARFGIYAGAGVSPPETIYEAPLFFFVRNKFAKLGYGKAELKSAWAAIDISPDNNFSQTPFIMALGKMDRVVKYDKAVATLNGWQQHGQDIQIITKARLGHFGIIRWYKNHINELLAEAERLTA